MTAQRFAYTPKCNLNLNMSNLCYFSRKRFNTSTLKWNKLKWGGVFLFISGVTIFILSTRNHLQKKDCWPSLCSHSSAVAVTVGLPGEELPLCTGNLLDKREHHYAKEADGSYDNSRLISKSGSCRLIRYTFDQVVDCFDALYERHYSARRFPNNLISIDRRTQENLHFVFIGDSRIRQQFINFLKFIPDFDWQSEPSPLPYYGYQGDMEVTSDVFQLRLSFHWQPLINDTIINMVHQWAIGNETGRPNLIFLGMAVWHMLQNQGADFKLYKRKLTELAASLGQLAKVSQVIWLNQYPTVELFVKIDGYNSDIHSEKIHYYNQAIRQILGDHKSVRIWDSSNPLAEEYVRVCAFSQRVQYAYRDSSDSFYNCKDFSHTGYSALSQATQLLFNDICNDQKQNYMTLE